MAIDFKAMQDYAKNVKARAKEGDSRVFKQKDINEGEFIDLRLLEWQPNQLTYVVETTTYWINKKPYLVGTFCGRTNVIDEEIQDALATGDKGIAALLDDRDIFSKHTDFYIPVKIVEMEQDTNTGEVTKVSFPYPTKDIFCCSISVLDKINDLICDKRNIAGREGKSLFHTEKGKSITVKKEVKNKITSYKVEIGLEFAMPKGSADPAKSPDIIAYLQKGLKSDAFLRGVIRNFLRGEPMPTEDIWKEEHATTPVASTNAVRQPVRKPVASAVDDILEVEAEEVEEEAPAPKRNVPAAKTPPPMPKPKPRSLADDLEKVRVEDLDDLEDLED